MRASASRSFGGRCRRALPSLPPSAPPAQPRSTSAEVFPMPSDLPEQLIRTLNLRYRRARLARLRRRSPTCRCHQQPAAGSLDEELAGEVPPRPARQPRNLLLFHGTTLGVARKIQADQRMAAQTTYLTMGWRNRDLARVFAQRASRRRPRDGGPALVVITVTPKAYE